MHAMIESRWATGTYDMLVEVGLDTVVDGDIGITIFATPLTLDPADDQDAPILAQLEADSWDVDISQDALNAMPRRQLREVGEHGLKPEDFEAEYGPKLALRILLALYNATETDMQGTDMEGRPWRQPSAAAGALRERVLDLMVLLTTRLAGA